MARCGLLLGGLVLGVSILGGCGGSAAMQAASSGDLDTLRTELDRRSKADDVDLGEAKNIAHRMLSRQIVGAKGDAGERTLAVLPKACVLRVDGALAERAKLDDELAALAMMKRIDAGLEDELAFAAYVDRAEPHWRAVGARTLNRPFDPDEHGKAAENQAKEARWRQDLLVDPSTLVRRGALLAAAEAGHPGDTRAVLEAARLDPDEDNRIIAIEALGAIGTREAVMGLKDLWDAAGEDARLTILKAWGAASLEEDVEVPCNTPPQRAACVAQYHLRRISEGGAAMDNLTASLAIIDGVDPEERTTEQGNAAGVVERLIDESSTRVRVHAITHAPVAWPRLLVAIEEAKDDANPLVAVAANARLLSLGGEDAASATKKLKELAEDGVGAEEARRALAAAGDASQAKVIDPDLADPSRETRSLAGVLMAQMKQVNRALPLLADRDPGVRSRVACAILDIDG